MNQSFQDQDPDNLKQLWETMQGEKGDIEKRTEEYAYWTIPSICPAENTAHQEQVKGDVAIGARLVNHLANRIVDTMFPHDRPFFTITLTPEIRKKLREEMGPDAEVAFADTVREETANVEQIAMRKLKLSAYRPQAVLAVLNMIISGNVVIRRLPDGSRTVYGIKDFCIRRDVTGKMIELLLKDSKKFGSLPEPIKAKVLATNPEYKKGTDCNLYTHFYMDGIRWAMRQGVDMVTLPTVAKYRPVDLPVLPLVWRLARGENYARGAVEDHAPAFHQVDVLTKALIDMVGIMADIKFFVDPSSGLDPYELNNSRRGSFHQAREGDVTATNFAKGLEISGTMQIIQGLEQELARGFLLNSAGVRNAERVTAEEIRFIATELESAFGGLYSRLAIEWQQHEAEYAVSQIDFDTELGDSKLPAFEVVITTGLESLSREGQLDNLRRALADIQMLDGIPDEIRATLNPTKFASFIFTNHSVNWREFLFTDDEMKANRDAALQQEQQMLQMQAGATAQAEAGKLAAQESIQ